MRFVDYPKKVDVKYYDSIRKRVMKYYMKNSDILAVYEYGKVKSPGISDLDLILITKKTVENDPKKLEITNVGEDAFDILRGGTVMKMPATVFAQIKFIDDLQVSKLCGKSIAMSVPLSEQKQFISFASLIDWIPERILRMQNVLGQKELRLANTLCLLNSYCFSLRILSTFVKDKKRDEYIKEVKDLRSRWFETIKKKEKVLRLLREGVVLGYRSLKQYESFLRKKKCYLKKEFRPRKDIVLELTPQQKIVFSTKNKEKSISAFFYPHFAWYAQQPGLLARKMRQKINPFIEIGEDMLERQYQKTLERKMNICEENAQHICNNNIAKGLMRFGFHLDCDAQEKLHSRVEAYFNTGKGKAEELSKVFRTLKDKKTVETVTVSIGKIDEKSYQDRYLKPILELRKQVEKELKPYVKDFIIHGSIATLDYTKGWSDLDTMIIVKDSVLKDPNALKECKDKIKGCRKYLYQIDPLQHHGFMIYSEYDINNYLDLFIPTEALKGSVSLLKKSNITFRKVKQTNSLKLLLKKRIGVFKEAKKTGTFKHHAYKAKYLKEKFKDKDTMYQLKYFLASLMTFPSLYLTAIGKPCHKKESFAKVKKGIKNWDIVKKASKIRKRWPQEEKHPLKGNRIPQWVQKELGKDYFDKAVLFLKELEKKL